MTGILVAPSIFAASMLVLWADSRRHAADPDARATRAVRVTTLVVLVGVLTVLGLLLSGLPVPPALLFDLGPLVCAWVGLCGLGAVAANAVLLRR